jgi:hypothetical protein
MFHDLQLCDAELIAEFKAAVDELAGMLGAWIATGVSRNEYNAWNSLMHKVEHSLRAGMLAAARFCPDVQYDATTPAAGTLRARVELSLTQADTLRAAFLARHSTPQAKVLRKAGR